MQTRPVRVRCQCKKAERGKIALFVILEIHLKQFDRTFRTSILFLLQTGNQSKEFDERPKLTVIQRYRRTDTGISINRRFLIN